ncbi:MAG TPA: acetolactate synthase small subunit [Bacillota bacterium]
MKQIIAVLVQNSPGVLARVAGLFARRGFNIDSLAVGVTDNPAVSRMTIAFEGDARVQEQVSKQLNKLIDVRKVSELTPSVAISRELAMVKVHAEPARREQIVQLVNLFRAKIIDVNRRSLVVEVSGDHEKVEALLAMLREFGLMEVVRTGQIAMERGSSVTALPERMRAERPQEEDIQPSLAYAAEGNTSKRGLTQ